MGEFRQRVRRTLEGGFSLDEIKEMLLELADYVARA